jgi:hypothetical protein
MKISSVCRLANSEITVVCFARFRDHRGFGTEHYRESDGTGHPELRSLRGIRFRQMKDRLAQGVSA